MNETVTAPRPVDEIDLPVLPRFGPRDPARFEILREARERHWLARSEGGFTVLRYPEVVAMHRDARFVNGGNVSLRRAGITDERFLSRRPNPFLRAEGADHKRLRKLVAAAFSVRGAEKHRAFMRAEIDRMIDRVAAAGRAELIEDLFDPFPTAVICELLGTPREDWQLFFGWTRDIFQIYTGDVGASMDRILAAHQELDQYVEELIEKRRRVPGDDLLTELIQAEEAGDRLSTEELQSIVEAVLLAGTDTTRTQLGITLATVLQHPDQLAKLQGDPSLIPGAVEESLRFLSSVGGQPRYVPEETAFKDVIFPADTLLQTNFVSANVDPLIWGDDAERFDVSRKPTAGNGQLTFGIGRHICLGASIARVELEEMLATILWRMPNIAIDGGVEWRAQAGAGMWGAERFPVTFAPSTPAIQDREFA
ncbi:MAG: cytochrome P450 [Sphingomonadaceae bacterium]|nr:cytochrome P450 [Sphingomonadaceae bacterium]